MNKIWILAKRELKTFFDSLIAYVLLILFVGVTGFFTWIAKGNVIDAGQASMYTFFFWAQWTLLFFIPALTMRLLAEESKTGTIELLLTKAVNNWQVVTGKFLAVALLVLIALLLTLPYYFTMSSLGELDNGVVIMGYLSTFLMSAAYVAIGLFISSTTNNQIVAFLLALVVNFLFHLVFGLLAETIPFAFGFLSMQTHYNHMIQGLFDSTDIIYFLSIILVALALAEGQLAKRHIS